jgi:hypothetical protein
MAHACPPFLSRLLHALPLLLLAAPAAATTFVRMADGDLADAATVIAEVRVDAVQPSPAGAPLATHYQAAILRLLKGSPAGSSLVVRVPGGVGADGLALRISGAPELRPGDRPLLFLTARPDGTYAVLQLMLGAFHTAEVAGRRIALRNLTGAVEVPLPGRKDATLGEERPRDLERFAAWLADRAHGVTRPADYFVDLPEGERRALTEKFTVLSFIYKMRWFAFDIDEAVTFVAHPSGQPGLAGGGFAELQRAIAAWNDEPHTPLQYAYGGTNMASAGFTKYDQVNSVLWDDPNNEIGFPFDCQHGGILAISTPWFRFGMTGSFQNETLFEIIGGDVITNKNLGCFFSRFPSGEASLAAEEILAHELGHTLGLGHACGDFASPACSLDPVKNDALMRAFAHADGRGARLGADDVAALRYLYDPSPRALAPCRPSATALCLDGRRFQVEVDWRNQFDGSSGFGRAIPATDATGYFSFGDPGNIEILVKVLDFGGPIKVFYGELTNLVFHLRVTDTETGAFKDYGNTFDDCGDIDESFYDRTDPAGTALAPRRGVSGGCRPDKTTLCLVDGRFAVRVHWQNPFGGASGEGAPGALSNFVGTFSFSDRNNVELMVKLLPFPDRIALFYGALTDFDYTLEVSDLATGKVKTYRSLPGLLCGGLDNSAF